MRLSSIVFKVVMHRVFNVAEKNDAAKSLARLLSKNSSSMVNKFLLKNYFIIEFSVKDVQDLIKFMNLIISFLINRCK
jgi:hypothetical protein